MVVQVAATTVANAAAGAAEPMRSEQDLLADKIRDGNLLAVLATFFGFGLLLAVAALPLCARGLSAARSFAA